MARAERVLVIAHGHPDFSLGGGEIAAYRLYQAYRRQRGVDAAWFLARADRGRGVTGEIGLRRPGEYLWEQGVGDWHRMRAAHRDSLTGSFPELLRALMPTIVHVHHYAHLGLDCLRVIRSTLPGARLWLTLHEYMAICANDGQMVRAGDRGLCSRSGLEDCRACFPERSAEDFWLRRHAFETTFDLVDRFIAPSEFLRGRYADWGIDPARISVIENGQHDASPIAARALAEGEGRNRFGFFGQINPHKGLDVLLEAMAQVPAGAGEPVLEVHGANLDAQVAAFRERIAALRAPLVDSGRLHWAGPYRPEELRGRMAALDWVVVPSVWWENSPMVIQEAFACGRPVIASGIGGMAEKVADGVDGLHVAVGNPREWARTMRRGAAEAGLWERLRSGIRAPITEDACARAHLALAARDATTPARARPRPARGRR